jgi:hypothetical protein
MSNKITVIKGSYKKLKISNTTFTLLAPVRVDKGITTALVDASAVLGADYKRILVDIEDYRV